MSIGDCWVSLRSKQSSRLHDGEDAAVSQLLGFASRKQPTRLSGGKDPDVSGLLGFATLNPTYAYYAYAIRTAVGTPLRA